MQIVENFQKKKEITLNIWTKILLFYWSRLKNELPEDLGMYVIRQGSIAKGEGLVR
jgi:hypothetical protein